MKKILLIIFSIIIFVIVLVFLITLCLKDRMILKGYYKAEEYFDKNGFQDYADYCKYYYHNDNPFKKSKKYKIVNKDDVEKLTGYFDNFKNWMIASDRLDEYDFKNDYISVGDYFYIKTKEGQKIGDGYYKKYDDYTIYFYDTNQNILYYIHSNI